MTYIENVFLCLALPLMVSLFFLRGATRRFVGFLVIGMGTSLLSAYVSSFFMRLYGVDAITAAREITPVCEEVMKLLPLLIYLLVFEPRPSALPPAAIAISTGFATFENVCYLTQNGAESFTFMLIRGISAGALHILCGVTCGFGLEQVLRHRWLAVTGMVGLLGFCVGFHGIYNLLVSAQGAWPLVAYLFPSVAIACLFVLGWALPGLDSR